MNRKLITLLVPLVFAVIAVLYVFFRSNPGDEKKEVLLIVPKGSTLSTVADSLRAHDLISSKLFFTVAARALNAGPKLHAGTFRISGDLSNIAIVKRLTGTEYALILNATFPEGYTMQRFAQIAFDRLRIDSALFLQLVHNKAYLAQLGLPKQASSAEGYLFPDTYQFMFSVDPKSLIVRMTDRWKQIVNDSVKKEIAATGLSLHEFMTLASIVESEAKRAEERDTIAGVYWNRLKKGMKLDADPTVQYGLHLVRPITHDDLGVNTPYNTYLNKGLPPGPINNPGAASIRATLHPAKHNKIYFVTRKDGSGGHYFSSTIDEQSRSIAQSRKNSE